jgi:hypothetical protein
MPAAAPVPFVCLAYPQLVWEPAAVRHPRDHTYCWRAHFKTLVATARKVHADQPLVLRVAHSTERWFVAKLATMTDSEVEVATMMIDAKQRPNPLGFLDPSDPGVPRPAVARSDGDESA